MLVLTRKIGERIVLHVDGTTVQIQLVCTRRGSARIGIKAPKNVTILRKELDKEKSHPESIETANQVDKVA